MNFIKTAIEGLIVIEPQIWKDQRGYFYESYNKQKFEDGGIVADFVQDNQSFSQRGTLRGLHCQEPPFAQGKLVRVIQGSVIDIAVDARKNSPTYGKSLSIELSGENQKMLWVPPGFLHGFVTLINNTIFTYKVSGLYNKASEMGVIWDDHDLNLDWVIDRSEIILSEKDMVLPSFKDFNSPF